MAALIAISGWFTGCASTGSNYPSAVSNASTQKVTFEIQALGRNTAKILINGEDMGDTPVLVRLDADFTGSIAEDVVIKAEWNGGGNDTELRIPRGTRPQSVVRIGPNGEREY